MSATAERKKRGRTVFPSQELYHVWAHQRAPRGWASGQNVYFEGPTIYSYGSHFPMARLLFKRGKVGPVAVLITTRSYSNTTSGHQSDVRRAVSHLKRFYVRDVLNDTKGVLKEYRDSIESIAKSVGQPRIHQATRESRVAQMQSRIKEANSFAEFVGLKTRFKPPEGFSAENARSWVKALTAREIARAAAGKARKLKLARAQYAVAIAEYRRKENEWLLGETPLNDFPHWKPRDPDSGYVGADYDTPVRLRVHGTRIETSKGVVFEVEKARPILAVIRRGSKPGPDGKTEPFRDETFDIDGYTGVTIDFDARTVSVGCHTVEFDEVERIAAQVGL